MLNLGLRYERDSKFKDNNFAPRIGFNWSPDAKTVVRANYGWFYDRYRLGIAEAVPSLGGFNGQGLVEIDYPRLAVDAPGLSRTFGAVANFLKDPLFINKARRRISARLQLRARRQSEPPCAGGMPRGAGGRIAGIVLRLRPGGDDCVGTGAGTGRPCRGAGNRC